MKRNKLLKAAVIILTLVFAATSIAYADPSTVQFDDIENSWAKQHIINVYNKGYMGGVSEKKFNPTEKIKQYDVLVSISRMIIANSNDSINLSELVQKYKESVLDKFKVPDYAREGIALCLEKNIITDSDIGIIDLRPYADKKDVSKYLGKALGFTPKEDDVPFSLSFMDTLLIPTVYRPYVGFLVEKGVITDTGDTTQKFNPYDNVTREMFAKMLDLTDKAYNNEAIDTGVTVEEGPAKTEEPSKSEDSGNSGSSDYKEPVVETGEEPDETVYVDEAFPEYGNLAVFLGTERRVYKIAENAKCTMDGSPYDWWRLKKSDLAKLYIEDGKVVRIVAESKIQKVVGELVSISTGNETILTMKTNNGETKKYTITDKTVVIKDAKRALWQELKQGNSLVITTSYNELLEINADGVKGTDKGVIESITFSRMAPPRLIITALDGSQNTYYADEDVEISGTGDNVYSLRPGMQVEVNLIDDEINKINVIKAVEDETATIEVVLSGQIKQLDKEAKLIILETFDKTLNKYVDKKVFITGDTRIGDAYLNILGINDLKENQLVDVRGTGSLEGISAKVIQIK